MTKTRKISFKELFIFMFGVLAGSTIYMAIILSTPPPT